TGGNADIYVKLVGNETALRLTTHPGTDSNPAWSPDGRAIVFLRQSPGESAYYMIPAVGGPERRLATVFPYQLPGTGNSAYYAPDGRQLVISDKAAAAEPLSLFLLSLETRERARVTFPP